jgi:hypothetical protein
MSLELPKLLAEHLDGDSRHGPPKLAESESAFAEPPEDHWFPATLDHANRRVNGALLAFDVDCILLSHGMDS